MTLYTIIEMVNTDSLDERLIKLLQKDAGQSSEVIAKHLKVSAATVRRRIRLLIKNKVIRIAAIADPDKTGLPLAVIITIDVSHEKLDSVMQTLANQPEILWISTTTGRYDIIALTRFHSTDDLSIFLQNEMPKIEGIRDTETFICLNLESKGTIYSPV